MTIDSLVNDNRPIQSVTMAESGRWWAVGREGVTKIEPYLEAGQGAMIPWLAICEGDDIGARVNCAAVECIFYDAKE